MKDGTFKVCISGEEITGFITKLEVLMEESNFRRSFNISGIEDTTPSTGDKEFKSQNLFITKRLIPSGEKQLTISFSMFGDRIMNCSLILDERTLEHAEPKFIQELIIGSVLNEVRRTILEELNSSFEEV